MAKFSARNIIELESNENRFIESIALAEDSKCNQTIKEAIIKKIHEVIIHSEIALEEISS